MITLTLKSKTQTCQRTDLRLTVSETGLAVETVHCPHTARTLIVDPVTGISLLVCPDCYREYQKNNLHCQN